MDRVITKIDTIIVKLLEHNIQFVMKYCILYRIRRDLKQAALQKHVGNGQGTVN